MMMADDEIFLVSLLPVVLNLVYTFTVGNCAYHPASHKIFHVIKSFWHETYLKDYDITVLC